jgi:hypothetical protein
MMSLASMSSGSLLMRSTLSRLTSRGPSKVVPSSVFVAVLDELLGFMAPSPMVVGGPMIASSFSELLDSV